MATTEQLCDHNRSLSNRLISVFTLSRYVLFSWLAIYCFASPQDIGAGNLPDTRPEAVGFFTDRLNRIETAFQRYIDDGEVPGFVVAIAKHGKIAYLKKMGLRDIENELPMERDTIFRIYSMSKAVTSVAAMILYEEGHFELSDSVSDHLPEFKEQLVYVSGPIDDLRTRAPNKPMTIQQLFTHSSGLSYGGDTTVVDSIYRALALWESADLAELTRKIASAPLRFEPGTQYHYSTSIDVLGRLIEVSSGQSLGEFMQDRVFEPLGMDDTGFYVKPDKINRFSVMYRWVADDSTTAPSLVPILDQDFTEPRRLQSGGGGLVSTIDDYLVFCQMILNQGELDGNRILGSRTVRYMSQDHLVPGVSVAGAAGYDGLGHGLGFGVVTNPTLLGRIGNVGELLWGGYANTFFWIDPTEDMVSMVWTQMIPWGIRDFRHQLMPLVHSAIID